jgi:hypothetical protein
LDFELHGAEDNLIYGGFLPYSNGRFACAKKRSEKRAFLVENPASFEPIGH